MINEDTDLVFADLKEDPMDNETDTIGGYAVPMDPMDLLQCDSCQ